MDDLAQRDAASQALVVVNGQRTPDDEREKAYDLWFGTGRQSCAAVAANT